MPPKQGNWPGRDDGLLHVPGHELTANQPATGRLLKDGVVLD